MPRKAIRVLTVMVVTIASAGTASPRRLGLYANAAEVASHLRITRKERIRVELKYK